MKNLFKKFFRNTFPVGPSILIISLAPICVLTAFIISAVNNFVLTIPVVMLIGLAFLAAMVGGISALIAAETVVKCDEYYR